MKDWQHELFVDVENVVDGDLLVVGYALNDEPVTALTDEDLAVGMVPEFEEPWRFLSLLANPNIAIVEHTKHDAHQLARAGYDVQGPILDTQVMAWVLNENTPLDLDWLAFRYAGIDMDKRLRRSAGIVYFEFSDGTRLPLDEFLEHDRLGMLWRELLEYNVRDVEAGRAVYRSLRQRMDEAEWTDYWRAEEVPYTGVLFRMEQRGLPINLGAVAELAEELEPLAVQQRADLMESAGLPEGFNLNSQKQLGEYLFSRVMTVPTRIGPKEVVEAYKSCVAGEHEDCDDSPAATVDGGEALRDTPLRRHIVDLLPSDFTLESVGRDYLIGYRSVKGRGLVKTPHTINKVTGEPSKYPSVASPDLLYYHGNDPWVRELCTGYRKTNKVLTTYLRVFPKVAREVSVEAEGSRARDGALQNPNSTVPSASTRIFCSFKQTGTVTGRLSSAGPNLQNQPSRGTLGKRVRALYQGNFVIGDYDQLEMRIMATVSEDPRLLRVFREGLDPHVETMRAIFGEVDPYEIAPGAALSYRDAAKQLNYAMGYGAGKKKVAQTLSLFGFPTTPEVAGEYLAELQRHYRVLFRWNEHQKQLAKRKGSVRTMGGRRRRLKGAFKDTANWKAVGYGERQAVNAIIQGTAADILRRTMVRADEAFPELKMLAQVHDEVIWEHPGLWLFDADPKMLPELQECMETGHGFDLKVPLVFEPVVTDSWAGKSGASLVDVLLDESEEYDDAE